jgi:hypothetical protein
MLLYTSSCTDLLLLELGHLLLKRPHLCHQLLLLARAAHVSIRQHTSAHVSILHPCYQLLLLARAACVSRRQHKSDYISIRLHPCYQLLLLARAACVSIRQIISAYVCIRAISSSFSPALHTSAYFSTRQHTSKPGAGRASCGSIRQHTSAYVIIRQHTSAYGSIRQHTSRPGAGRGSCLRPPHTQPNPSWRSYRGPSAVPPVSIRQHTQHTSAHVSLVRSQVNRGVHIEVRQLLRHVSIRQHTSAYASIRQHTSAYGSLVLCQIILAFI